MPEFSGGLTGDVIVVQVGFVILLGCRGVVGGMLGMAVIAVRLLQIVEI